MPTVSSGGDNKGALGRIALKQVRVTRAELEARQAAAKAAAGGASAPVPAQGSAAATQAAPSAKTAATKGQNPMNKLVPFLDLFCRLDDEEMSRLAQVPVKVVVNLRRQVEDVATALDPYVDLLARLKDDELVRLTGATDKTVRFWRLSQPKDGVRVCHPLARDAAKPEATPPSPAPAPIESSPGAPTPSGVRGMPAPQPGATPVHAAEATGSGSGSGAGSGSGSGFGPQSPVPQHVAPQSTPAPVDISGQPFPGFETGGRRPVDSGGEVEIGMFEDDDDDDELDPLADDDLEITQDDFF